MRFFLILIVFCSITARADNREQFVSEIDKQNWDEAITKTSDRDLHNLVTWLKLTTEKEVDFYELTTFIKQHSKWPKIDVLLRKAEEVSFDDYDNKELLIWFTKYPPKLTKTKLKYLNLLNNEVLRKQYIRKIWHSSSFSNSEEKEFLKKYKSMLSLNDYIKRINNLLYSHNIEQATRALKHLPKDMRKTYSTRLSIKKGKTHSTNINHKTNIGILHDIALNFHKNGDEDNLVKVLKVSSGIKHSEQVYFWSLKVRFIRTLIQQKAYKTAYLFASSHGHKDIKEYSEAEWLSGWIALRFLDNPNLAISHFKNFYKKVKLPISLSRGAYWIGRSYDKINDIKKSNFWYGKASKYYTSFYGQLSICKINNCKLKIPANYKIDKAEVEKYKNSPLVKSALLLQKTSYYKLSKIFLLKAIDNSSDSKRVVAIANMKLDLEQDHHLGAELAKQASYKNILISGGGYPNPKFIHHKEGIEKSLVLALIRQESIFNQKAISSAGAMGLMQIMPHVAKKTAADINIKYSKNKLIKDPIFNTRLGVSHLDELLINYDDSYVLSIAAYNAGSKAVNKWIEDNGDPRLMKKEEDIIDWMETITYYETRNYVQRVLENRAIYNAILNKDNKLKIRY